MNISSLEANTPLNLFVLPSTIKRYNLSGCFEIPLAQIPEENVQFIKVRASTSQMIDNPAADVVTGIKNSYSLIKGSNQVYCVNLIGSANTTAFYFFIS